MCWWAQLSLLITLIYFGAVPYHRLYINDGCGHCVITQCFVNCHFELFLYVYHHVVIFGARNDMTLTLEANFSANASKLG